MIKHNRLYESSRKLQAAMWGFPYSRHRSKRIVKKLIKRAKPRFSVYFDNPSTTCDDFLVYTQVGNSFLNDASDAVRYAWHVLPKVKGLEL